MILIALSTVINTVKWDCCNSTTLCKWWVKWPVWIAIRTSDQISSVTLNQNRISFTWLVMHLRCMTMCIISLRWGSVVWPCMTMLFVLVLFLNTFIIVILIIALSVIRLRLNICLRWWWWWWERLVCYILISALPFIFCIQMHTITGQVVFFISN